MGGDRSGGPGRGRGASRALSATGLALPYLISPQFPPGGCLSLTEKTSAAATAADAGLVFYYYGGHRIILEIDNRNRPTPLVASAEATGERGQSLYRYWFNSLQWAREIIFCVVRTPKAGGSGPFLGTRIGGVYKMQNTLGAELTARCVPEACEPTS